MYNFQADENAVPVFYINKNCWNDEYKQLIRECLHYRMAYLLCELEDKSMPHMEVTCTCLKIFEDYLEMIEKCIGVKHD